MKPEYLELLKELIERLDDHGHCKDECCEKCPPSAPVNRQYEQSLARFNDTSSQTVNQMQSANAQLFQTWGAHMLKLQDQITRD